MADEVSRNKYDMIICDMYVSFMREQITAGSNVYDVDFLGKTNLELSEQIRVWASLDKFKHVYLDYLLYNVDFLGIVTSKPSIRPKYLNLIYPYNSNVWIAIFITFGTVTVALFVISRIEGSILNVQFVDWLTIPGSLWYVYGTFVGESISRE